MERSREIYGGSNAIMFTAFYNPIYMTREGAEGWGYVDFISGPWWISMSRRMTEVVSTATIIHHGENDVDDGKC